MNAREEQNRRDDQILDEETPATGSSTQNSNSSLDETLANLTRTLTSLTNRMSSLEETQRSHTLVGRKATVSAPTELDRIETASLCSDNPEDLDIEATNDEGDRDMEASYLEMLTSIKSLLHMDDPEIEQIAPPSAFKKRTSTKNTKKQISAFPPEQEIASMWDFRTQQVSGKNSQGISNQSPLHLSHFIHYARMNMNHYLTIPQTSTLRPQKFPESFHNLGREKIPTMVDLP